MTAVHSDEGIVDEITQNYLIQCVAMVGADVSELRSLPATDVTLTHMTGYLQGRAEWLDDTATGQMTYHSIRNVDIVPDIPTDSATITARSHTHARIWGAEGTSALWERDESREFHC